jgi:hypothetical protein
VPIVSEQRGATFSLLLDAVIMPCCNAPKLCLSKALAWISTSRQAEICSPAIHDTIGVTTLNATLGVLANFNNLHARAFASFCH